MASLTKDEMIGEMSDFLENNTGTIIDCHVTDVGDYFSRSRSYYDIRHVYTWVFTKFYRAIQDYRKAVENGGDISNARIAVLASWLGRPK